MERPPPFAIEPEPGKPWCMFCGTPLLPRFGTDPLLGKPCGKPPWPIWGKPATPGKFAGGPPGNPPPENPPMAGGAGGIGGIGGGPNWAAIGVAGRSSPIAAATIIRDFFISDSLG